MTEFPKQGGVHRSQSYSPGRGIKKSPLNRTLSANANHTVLSEVILFIQLKDANNLNRTLNNHINHMFQKIEACNLTKISKKIYSPRRLVTVKHGGFILGHFTGQECCLSVT